MRESSEQRLILKAQNGDMDALEEILKRNEKAIYLLALSMCGNEQDAMDVGQEAAVRIWRNLPNFRGDSKLSTWIHRIAHNACIDFLRKRRDGDAPLDELKEIGVEPVAPSTETPEQTLERKETYRSIDEALLSLPDEHRAAVVQRDVLGLSYDEIATAQEANLNTIKSRIARGRKQLASLLR